MKMTKKEMIDYAATQSSINADYSIEKKFSMFPFIDKDSGEAQRSAALVVTMSHVIKEDHKHTVILAYKEDGYFIWCGDGFISGKKISKSEAVKHTKRASESQQEEKEMMKLFGSTQDKGCRFWAKGECSHTNTVLALVDDDHSILDTLETMYVGKKVTIKNRTPEEMLEKLQFKKHVLLKGDKGSGKTYLADEFAKKCGAEVFFLGGNNSTKPEHFLGEYLPLSVEVKMKGQRSLFEEQSISQVSMVWKDGKLSQAFRYAAAGNKAIFLLDELQRVPRDVLSILISSLTPVNGKYNLNTERAIAVVDGIAEEEIISCPVQNLWVIGTTNVGAGYDVFKPDEAFKDRFQDIRKDTDTDVMQKVLKSKAKAKSYPVSSIEPLIAFYKLYEKMRRDGSFKSICNQRHLGEAIDLSVDVDDLKESLWENREAWVCTDINGKPRKEQEELIEKLLDKCFAA